jgi:hypothetical protein
MEVRPERELPCCSQLLTGLYIAESRFVCACMCVCVYVINSSWNSGSEKQCLADAAIQHPAIPMSLWSCLKRKAC